MYQQFYQLKTKPFQLSPDPRFFFYSNGHKRALAYLRYGIKQGEGFIIITGNVGTGKSTLVSMLFKMLSKENVVGAQVVTTQMGPDDLLRMVSAEFGLPYSRISKAVMLKNLEEFCRACVQEGKRVLLVVDEAQALPPRAIEELRMLSNFQYRGRSLFQSFLLGQREFRQTMRSKGFEQLRQRVIAAYHLKPLDAEETRQYVEHRLNIAGWHDDPGIDAEVYPGIHEFSEGVPRRINTLCDRLLLFTYLENLHTVDLQALQSVTDDIIGEHDGSDDDSAGDDNLEGAPALRINKPVSKPAAKSNSKNEDRLSEVESSVSALTKMLKSEMTLLRESLAEQKKLSAKSSKETND